MMRSRLFLLTVMVSAVMGLSGQSRAQQDEPVQVDATVFIESTPDVLRLRLAPIPLAELEQLKQVAMGELRRSAEGVAGVLIAHQQALTAGASPEQLVTLQEKALSLNNEKIALISRINLLLAAVEAKGGDIGAARSYVQEVDRLRPDFSAPAYAELSPEEEQRAASQRRADELIAEVRAMPPVHERAEPWTVSVSELTLELQPLRMTQIEERVQAWLNLLQQQIRNRVRMEIAAENETDPAIKAVLVERASEQQRVIRSIVERLEAMLVLLQRRGGDVTEYRDYIANATGQRLNLTDPTVLATQANSWIRSPDGGIRLGLNVLKFTAILVAFWILSRILARVTRTAVNRLPKASNLLRSFLIGGITKLTLLIGLIVAVNTLGVNITPLIAAIGAAGLVIGLALQGTLSNFASGLLILIYRPFDVGDAINAGGVLGTVESLNLVSTRILTFDNQIMIVPNNQIWNGVITNITGQQTRRVDLTFGVGYGDDLAKAQKILEDVVKAHAKVLATPEPVIKVHQLADHSVNFIVRPWALTSDYWDVYWDLTRAVKERFTQEGISIPFPQRDLHIPGTIEVKLTGDASSAGAGSLFKEAKPTGLQGSSGGKDRGKA